MLRRERMIETVTVEVNLHAFIRRETRTRWVAVCPSVGVASQGETEPKARRAIQEAVQFWFESCIERGTLDRALKDANFRPVPAGTPLPEDAAQFVSVNRKKLPDDAEDVRGTAFDIHVAIPAYQAAAFLG